MDAIMGQHGLGSTIASSLPSQLGGTLFRHAADRPTRWWRKLGACRRAANWNSGSVDIADLVDDGVAWVDAALCRNSRNWKTEDDMLSGGRGMAIARGMAVPNFRTNFAINHLKAAARAAQGAHEVETANDTSELGQWFDTMFFWVPVSVVMAGAALEASANELIQDILDYSPQLADSRKILFKDLKNEQSGNATKKFRQIALLLDKIPTRGGASWQDAEILVRFRNSFMHFTPSWDWEESKDVEKGLETRIRRVSGWKGAFFFPHSFMTYECAKWAVQTVLNFSRVFSQEVGVQERFAVPHLDWTLP
jgi:hypothetical protein